jgi:hypothetical protein
MEWIPLGIYRFIRKDSVGMKEKLWKIFRLKSKL